VIREELHALEHQQITAHNSDSIDPSQVS
jgi:hypothetical protein